MPVMPAYRKLLESGELEQRAAQAHTHLAACDVCPRNCGKDRTAGKLGVCRTGMQARVSSYGPHRGEERPLSGWRGSGTIFFGGCNLRCQYCQNHEISQTDSGREVEPQELAAIMLELQSCDCHNINLVSPSHVVPQILAAVSLAAQDGLVLPLVYNTGGYDSISSLQLLEGVVDIYIPDMKYASDKIARHYSKVSHYPEVNQAAVLEMHRQVGDLQVDANGLATRGLLVRHLVLPHGLGGTAEIVRFLSEQVSAQTYLNLMDQYYPAYNARQFPKLMRRITRQEWEAALQAAVQAGICRLDGEGVN